MRQRQGGSRAAPRQCWRQHPLLLDGDGFHRRTPCLAHTEIVAHSELMHRQSGSKAAPVQRQRQRAANRWRAGRSAAQAATLGDYTETAAVNFFYLEKFYINIYIYLSLSLFNQRKSCRNYKCSSLWEKEFCLHKFVSGRISVRRKRRRRRRRRRRRTPEKLRTSHKDVGKKHK